ncbi:MAG: VOC family protein [Ardenticatenaceae bacterium]|nr:VOC family protein [Ardenticatenaceae bacterium]MCB8947760.1 VOC family protein [Ardenticatenaceae bacterium]
MNKTFKPEGYASLSPYLVVDGAQKLIDFLLATFGAKVTRRFDNEDGSLMHGEVMIDDTVVMLSDASESYPAFPVWLHVYVPDVAATYAKALAAGGISVQEPVKKDDPDLRAGVQDPTGNTWWLATQVE